MFWNISHTGIDISGEHSFINVLGISPGTADFDFLDCLIFSYTASTVSWGISDGFIGCFNLFCTRSGRLATFSGGYSWLIREKWSAIAYVHCSGVMLASRWFCKLKDPPSPQSPGWAPIFLRIENAFPGFSVFKAVEFGQPSYTSGQTWFSPLYTSQTGLFYCTLCPRRKF